MHSLPVSVPLLFKFVFGTPRAAPAAPKYSKARTCVVTTISVFFKSANYVRLSVTM